MTREVWTKSMGHKKSKLRFKEYDILSFADKILNAYNCGYKQAMYEVTNTMKHKEIFEELLVENKQEETSECCDALVVMGFCNNCKEHV